VLEYPKRFLQIDEEGYWISDGIRVNDPEYGAELFQSLKAKDKMSEWNLLINHLSLV
jgi:hypothetical protein